jgi:hypothetical protein
VEVQGPAFYVDVEAERARMRRARRRRLESQKDGVNRNRERLVGRCGQPDGDARREDDDKNEQGLPE